MKKPTNQSDGVVEMPFPEEKKIIPKRHQNGAFLVNRRSPKLISQQKPRQPGQPFDFDWKNEKKQKLEKLVTACEKIEMNFLRAKKIKHNDLRRERELKSFSLKERCQNLQ